MPASVAPVPVVVSLSAHRRVGRSTLKSDADQEHFLRHAHQHFERNGAQVTIDLDAGALAAHFGATTPGFALAAAVAFTSDRRFGHMPCGVASAATAADDGANQRSNFLARIANISAVLADAETAQRAIGDATEMFDFVGGAGPVTAESGAVTGLGPPAWVPAPREPGGRLHFYELVWDRESHGLRPDMFDTIPRLPPTAVTDTDPYPELSPWIFGRVQRWDADRRLGFIIADDGEFFYFDERHLAIDVEPVVGSRVRFRPRPPLIVGKNRVAVRVDQCDANASPTSSPSPKPARVR